MQSKKRAKLFWMSAVAPLMSVIIGSLLVYFTHAEKHGIQVVSLFSIIHVPIISMDYSDVLKCVLICHGFVKLNR